MDGSLRRAVLGLAAAGALALGAPAAAHASAWTAVAKPAATHLGHRAAIRASHLRAFKVDAAALRAGLAKAPKLALNARALSAGGGQVVSLPAPDGTVQRFSLQESPVMEPALAAAHPDIHTYAGRGVDDPTATIRVDDTPLGFHASVRSDAGNWYVDPYYHGDTSLYASYYGQNLTNTHGTWVESGDVPEGSDPLGLGLKKAAAAAGTVTLKTYRLALTSDQTYANYFGAANVTAAKVTLMNRVDQVYEDELAIRMILIGNNDKLNLNTDALAVSPHGPCGAQACFSSASWPPAAARRCRATGWSSASSSVPPTTTSATSWSARTAAASPASASSAATARPRAARASRHRRATSSRSTTWPTRWATSSAATTRSTARSSTARPATATARPRSSRARARRSWPTPASVSRTTCSRTATRTSPSAATTRSRPTRARRGRRSTRSRTSRSTASTAATRSRCCSATPSARRSPAASTTRSPTSRRSSMAARRSGTP